MEVSEILAEIDHQIALLEKARALLAGSNGPARKARKKRNLSPDGRRRIAEAVKRRWAEQKKKAGSK